MLVHQYESVLEAAGGRWRVSAHAEQDGHLWKGWLEFAAADGSAVRRTSTETSQPNRDAVRYWATGLEPVYLEGALARARERPERGSL